MMLARLVLSRAALRLDGRRLVDRLRARHGGVCRACSRRAGSPAPASRWPRSAIGAALAGDLPDRARDRGRSLPGLHRHGVRPAADGRAQRRDAAALALPARSGRRTACGRPCSWSRRRPWPWPRSRRSRAAARAGMAPAVLLVALAPAGASERRPPSPSSRWPSGTAAARRAPRCSSATRARRRRSGARTCARSRRSASTPSAAGSTGRPASPRRANTTSRPSTCILELAEEEGLQGHPAGLHGLRARGGSARSIPTRSSSPRTAR